MGPNQPDWVTRSWHNVVTDKLVLEIVYKSEHTQMTVSYPRTRKESAKIWMQISLVFIGLIDLHKIKQRIKS